MLTWRTESTPMNGSDQNSPSNCDEKRLILNLLAIIIAFVGVVGNAVVLWLLGFRVGRNAFSTYILNLAGADFLFLCLQIIDCMESVIDFFHPISISIPRFFTTVSIFAYLAGLSLLSIISTERCLSVLWPIWYRCHRPRHTSPVLCALMWALSLLLSILEGKYCGFLIRGYDSNWCQTFDFITVAWLIVLFVAFSGSSLVLIIRIHCGSQRMPLTRLYVTIGLTVLVFLFFGLPFGIYWFLLFWIQGFLEALPCGPYPVMAFLSCVNSCANPIIYFFVGSFRQRQWKRGTLKLILQRAMQDNPEEEESASRVSSGNLGK